MKKGYLLELGRLTDGKYYITREIPCESKEKDTEKETEERMALVEITEEEYALYNQGLLYEDNRVCTLRMLSDLVELLPLVSTIVRIPYVIEVETESEDPSITAFKVIRHISLEELDEYVEENRESLCTRMRDFCASELYHPVEDYDYIRSMMPDDSYYFSATNIQIIRRKETESTENTK